MQIRQFVPKPIRRFLSPHYQSFRKRREAYLGPFVQWNAIRRGYRYEIENEAIRPVPLPQRDAQENPLRTFFNNRTEGPGIWKWDHYFDIYDRHFNKFRGTEVRILEIGIFSGGSLDMWRDYFGPRAHIYGVDIEEACRAYEHDRTKILIGDQGDRQFWRTFREQVPLLDIVVDDGSHQTEDQIVTFEQLLPHLQPGGVYICEDLHGFNRFASYAHGIGHKLNDKCEPCTPFQSEIWSVHLYPFVAVFEKNDAPVQRLLAPKHGTQWQPFDPGAKSHVRGAYGP
jgi:hypothetical protein